jgi:hypothetical protein
MKLLSAVLGVEGERVRILWDATHSDHFPAGNVYLEDGRLIVVNGAGSKVLSERVLSHARVKGGWWKFTGPEKRFHVRID